MKNTNRGFTIFFAMLVASLSLAVGVAIYDLTSREIDLSSTATQSQFAIYAADTGTECALYWDAKAPVGQDGVPSAFGTSSASHWGASPLNCNGQDITVQGPPTVDIGGAYYPAGCVASAWCKLPAPGANATTTFRIDMQPGVSTTSCAVVQVAKVTTGGVLYTSVISRGYNTCVLNTTRLERTLQVSY